MKIAKIFLFAIFILAPVLSIELFAKSDISKILNPEVATRFVRVRPTPKPNDEPNSGLNLCPKDKPFAFLNGSFCCSVAEEQVSSRIRTRNSGQNLKRTSPTCKDNALKWFPCPGSSCENCR